MTGEDKMNRIFVYIGIIAGLLLGGSLSVEAQKKPLDIEACTSWKRIDAPDISPTGRWVTYRISLMEYNPASKEEKKLHLITRILLRRFIITTRELFIGWQTRQE